MRTNEPRVVIVGGGFGGLAAARALGRSPTQNVVIDRANHHLFQPLLYQVATAVLTPGQIGSPIREILRKHKNTTVMLGEVVGVDKDEKCVLVNTSDRQNVHIAYDYLILATGAHHSYFGHNEYEEFAPGLKSLADAVEIRNRILESLELAETEDDPDRHRELLTFVLVGAGPTGVEMAGAMAVLMRSLKSEFRRIDSSSARVILVDQSKRVLGSFSEDLSKAAHKRLVQLGVEVRLEQSVGKIDAEGVIVGGERISTRAVIWTAGVTPSPAGKWLGVETDRAGRVLVQPNLTVAGYPNVFVVGDTASMIQDGKPLPGVAQVAMQQGSYAATVIKKRIAGKPEPPAFRYFDKGSMAVVGKGFAILQSGPVRVSGLAAWAAWAAIHLEFLAQSNLRLSVFFQWVWMYFTGQRGSRLIVNHYGPPHEEPASKTVSEARSNSVVP